MRVVKKGIKLAQVQQLQGIANPIGFRTEICADGRIDITLVRLLWKCSVSRKHHSINRVLVHDGKTQRIDGVQDLREHVGSRSLNEGKIAVQQEVSVFGTEFRIGLQSRVQVAQPSLKDGTFLRNDVLTTLKATGMPAQTIHQWLVIRHELRRSPNRLRPKPIQIPQCV